MRMRGEQVLGPLLTALCLLYAAPASAQVSGPEAIEFLNAQRAASGLGPTTEHPDLSQGCVDHLNYMQQNPGAPFFGEDPAKPGYTPLGAGDPSVPVYSQGYIALFAINSPNFGPGSNPWERAPGHMAAAFDPTAGLAGYGQITRSDGVVEHCIRLAGFTNGSGVTLEAFIAPQGMRDVPYSVTVCCEGSVSPMEAAGLPNAIPTGPVITLYAYGPDRVPLKPVSQKLMQGKRRIRGVRFLAGSVKSDDTRAAMHGPASALIPARPLKPNTAYRVVLEWRKGRRLLDQVVRFRTSERTVG
jgi:hypothetical protein